MRDTRSFLRNYETRVRHLFVLLVARESVVGLHSYAQTCTHMYVSLRKFALDFTSFPVQLRDGVSGTRCLVPRTSCQVLAIEYSSTWFPVLGSRYLGPGIWHRVLFYKHWVPHTRYQVLVLGPSIWYWVSGAKCLSTSWQVNLQQKWMQLSWWEAVQKEAFIS